MIEFDKYSKKYGNHVVYNELSFQIPKGNILGLIGKNGSGKTTILKSIMNQTDYSGEIIIEPNLPTDNIISKEILYFTDNPFLYEYLTAEEFINFNLDLCKLSSPDTLLRKEKLIELFDLSEYKNTLISEYSLGMRKKTALIPYFLMQPHILIMDEPVLGVDIKSLVVIKKLLKKMAQNGTTIIITSHILEILENLADTLGVLHDKTITFYNNLNELTRDQIEEIYLSYINDEINEVIEKIF